jgi:hypothetical protein
MEGSCSFYSKGAPQVEKLVYGPGIDICQGCIEFAQPQPDSGNPTNLTVFRNPWRGLASSLFNLLTKGRTKRTTITEV